MTKQKLEEMFNEKFNWDLIINDWYHDYLIADEIKQFIFEKIILEVLKEFIFEKEKPKLWSENQDEYVWFANWYNSYVEDIKQKAKELYNIDL